MHKKGLQPIMDLVFAVLILVPGIFIFMLVLNSNQIFAESIIQEETSKLGSDELIGYLRQESGGRPIALIEDLDEMYRAISPLVDSVHGEGSCIILKIDSDVYGPDDCGVEPDYLEDTWVPDPSGGARHIYLEVY